MRGIIGILGLALLPGATFLPGATSAAGHCGSGGMPCPTDAAVAGLPAETLQNHVFFPAGGTNLDADARAQVARLASVMASPQLAGSCFKLVGHSDSSGSEARNMTVSRNRAQAVEDALAARWAAAAVPSANQPVTEVAAQGETTPLPSLDPANRAQRRVTIYAKRC
ncbi:MAG: OmpA family protein [Pseudomonadota bacterium]